MSDELPDLLKPETKEHYDANAAGFFKNVQDSERPGPSADELQQAAPRLLTPQQEQAYAERVERAADKTKRSGARTNSPSSVPGIFFDSLKNHSELLDEFTPGKYQEPEEAKPPERQIAPTGFFEKAEAVVEGFCLDCCDSPDKKNYVLGMAIAGPDEVERTGGKVGYGATVLYTVCRPCWESAKELTKDTTPLVLVFDGGLIPEKDVALARKYGFPISMHEGVEKSKGQWEMIKRAERLMDTLWSYIRAQNPDSLVFTRNRSKE